MSVFVHPQGIKTVHTKVGGVKKWKNSVQVVIECPLIQNCNIKDMDRTINLTSYMDAPKYNSFV